MCGIGGILRVWPAEQRALALRTPHAQSIPEAWLDILDDAVKHRGPDGQGRFRDRTIRADGCVVDVAFIHRRLSIIDHAGGHQPMVLQVPKRALSASSGSGSAATDRPIPGRLLTVEELQSHNRQVLAESHAPEGQDHELALRALSSHDRIAVVFNGCIYNHRELRAELQRAGHVFGTDHSDTEVLVHGWKEWKNELWRRLDGMFAVTIWDACECRLILARDAFGEKPLYYEGGRHQSDGTVAVAFASTAAAVIRLRASRWGDISKRTAHINAWLRYGFDPNPPIVSSHQVHNCTWVSLTGTLDPQPQYYRFFDDQGISDRTTPVSPDAIADLLQKSVAGRMESDVPLGCFLSGGVDSSLIAAMAKKSRGSLRTFTVRMAHDRLDESNFASRVAQHLGTEHRVIDCNPHPAVDLQTLIHELGVPLGDSSLLPSTWISRAASQHVRVALGGDGGDELFVGYDRYRAANYLSGPARPLLAIPWSVLPRPTKAPSAWERAHRLSMAAAGDGYLDLLSIFPRSLLNRLVSSGSIAAPRIDGRAAAIGWDLAHYLPDDILRKTDTASMETALEVRSPMLDRDLAHAAVRAPISNLCPRGQRKGLLRQVARKYLPPEIVDRPKMGFAIPIGEWFRTDYGGLRTMLLDHLNSTEPFGPPSLGIDLNMAFIRQMLDEHLGTGPSGIVKRDHSQRLYMLLVLSIWAKWLGSLR